MRKIEMYFNCVWAFTLCVLLLMLSVAKPEDSSILWLIGPILLSGLFATVFVISCYKLIKEDSK
jgi:hypothetical protein